MYSWCGCLRPPWGGTLHVLPSKIFKSACCTPSPDTSRVILTLSVLRPIFDFVDVNDANLRSFHVVIRILKEPQDDVFDVFADVAGFGQRCRVSNAKRHVQDPGKCLGKQCFAGASRSDE